MSLYDWLQAGGGAALLLMTLVQIAPIKINPWSAVARGIGKTMNKDMMDKLESVETEVKDLKEKHDKLESRMDKDDADACRTRIIRFADELTSRKLWTAVASFVSMMIVATGGAENTATQVTAIIMAGASVIAYIIGEGLTDAANVEIGEGQLLEADVIEEKKEQ